MRNLNSIKLEILENFKPKLGKLVSKFIFIELPRFDIFDIKSFFCYKHWIELVGFCPFPQKCICSVCGINFEMGKTRIGLGLFFCMMLWLHFLTYVMMTFDTKTSTRELQRKREYHIHWKMVFWKNAIVFEEKSITFQENSIFLIS